MNLLVTGAWSCSAEQLNSIKSLGHNILFQQNESDPLCCPYEDVDGVICNGLFLHHHIEKFTNLKYIQLTSAGFDRVPMEYVKAHNIEIHNARGVYSIPMAEFAVAGVLQLYKQSQFFYKNRKQHKWEKHRGLLELYGKTVCIVGCGSVGTECAKRFAAFGCDVIGVDLFPYDNPAYNKIKSLGDLDAVLSESDIVVLTLPLTEQTKYLMNVERFGVMKLGGILVNIARGAVVDTLALAYALRDRLGGAVLDVFEEEPLDEENTLWNMENVILTPHNSFVGDGNGQRLLSAILENLCMTQLKYTKNMR